MSRKKVKTLSWFRQPYLPITFNLQHILLKLAVFFTNITMASVANSLHSIKHFERSLMFRVQTMWVKCYFEGKKYTHLRPIILPRFMLLFNLKAMLSHWKPCDAAVQFDTYQNLQHYCPVFPVIAWLTCFRRRGNRTNMLGQLLTSDSVVFVQHCTLYKFTNLLTCYVHRKIIAVKIVSF